MAEEHKIRLYKEGDAAQLRAVFEQSIRGIGPEDYSKEQVTAWVNRGPEEAAIRARCADGRTTLVSENSQGEIVAYIDLENDGHIDHLYCSPQAAGTGVATALYARLETIACSRGHSRLYVEASEAARRFFERRGFTIIRKRHLSIENTRIHNYAMQKQL